MVFHSVTVGSLLVAMMYSNPPFKNELGVDAVVAPMRTLPDAVLDVAPDDGVMPVAI
jgi:hypothetical protein